MVPEVIHTYNLQSILDGDKKGDDNFDNADAELINVFREEPCKENVKKARKGKP